MDTKIFFKRFYRPFFIADFLAAFLVIAGSMLSAPQSTFADWSYDPAKNKTFIATSPSGRQVNVIVPRSSINASELAVIVNTQDPQSIAVGNYYQTARNIPPENMINVSFAPAYNISPAVFNTIKAQIDAATPPNIQAYAITWTTPWVVNNCMSITSAISFGYNDWYCFLNTVTWYYNSDSSTPCQDHDIRPSMALAGKDIPAVFSLIDRGVASDNSFPDGDGYAVKTTDPLRGWRTFDLAYLNNINGLNLQNITSTSSATNYLQNTDNILFYFTGLETVPLIETNQYRPGAVAEHLTSYGGRLTAPYHQMSILKWIDAGATGSYGTVIEPYDNVNKFPDITKFVKKYFQGGTLVEAYWKSVYMPVQGIFIGEPLARPYGTKVSLDDYDNLQIFTTTLIPNHQYSLLEADSPEGPFNVIQEDITSEYEAFKTINAIVNKPYCILADTSRERLILDRTGNTLSVESPQISGNKIVWRGSWSTPNAAFDALYVHDLATNAQRRITDRNVGNGKIDDTSISGDKIVWTDSRNGNDDIYMYDLTTNTERRITTNSSNQNNSMISDDKIVWEDWRHGGQEIYLYDLTTNTERQLTFNGAEYSPAISGNRVVWIDERNGMQDIYLYDLATNTERRLTTNPSLKLSPQISGDKIIWLDQHNLGADAQIYLYDLSVNTERRIAPESVQPYFPKISGDYVVWGEKRNNHGDIYLFDLKTNQERRITTDKSNPSAPAISGNKIIWTDNRRIPILDEIYLYDLGDRNPPSGSIKINNDASQTGNTVVTLSLSATDSESGLGTGAQMQFSNDGTTWSTPEAYATTKAWTLTTGDGTKTVYVKFKDAAGNWSAAVSDTIVLQTTLPAELTSPVPSSTLTNPQVIFQWNAGAGVTQYQLLVGKTVVAGDIYSSSPGANRNATIMNLPLTGPVYVRLRSQISGNWVDKDYVFQTAMPKLTSPDVATPIGTSQVNFTWDTVDRVQQFRLSVGTTGVGATNVFDQTVSSAIRSSVVSIPLNGQPVYVRLWSQIASPMALGSTWVYKDYVFQTKTSPYITAPSANAALSSAVANFQWTAGGVSEYQLLVGTTLGAGNIFNKSLGTNTSAVVTGIPINNQPVHVRLRAKMNNVWVENDSAYPTKLIAQMVNPVPGATINVPSVNFQWKAIVPGITQYTLSVGTTLGSGNIYNFPQGTKTAAIVNKIPLDGKPKYVRLGCFLDGRWYYLDFEYLTALVPTPVSTSAPTPAPSPSPTPKPSPSPSPSPTWSPTPSPSPSPSPTPSPSPK